jgi:hypothetical protein
MKFSSRWREFGAVPSEQQGNSGNRLERAKVALGGAPVAAQLAAQRQTPEAAVAVGVVEAAVEIRVVHGPGPVVEPLGDGLPDAPGQVFGQLLGGDRLAEGEDVLLEVVPVAERVVHGRLKPSGQDTERSPCLLIS